MRQLTVQTTAREQLVDITVDVQSAVEDYGGSAILVYSPHTTAGILVNEHADPDVARDVVRALAAIVPDDAGYRHVEGNSPAHVKAILVGNSQIVPLRQGRLALGRWQGVFLAEFDGPRIRTVLVTAVEGAG